MKASIHREKNCVVPPICIFCCAWNYPVLQECCISKIPAVVPYFDDILVMNEFFYFKIYLFPLQFSVAKNPCFLLTRSEGMDMLMCRDLQECQNITDASSHDYQL